MSKSYIRWDVRKKMERSGVVPPVPTGKCGSCGIDVAPGRKFCSRSCVSSANIRRNYAWEQAMAKRMEDSGWKMFSPSACCDRIGIKDGQLFLVEFKPKGREKLRTYQQAVKDLVPTLYRVAIGNFDANNVGSVRVTGTGFGVTGKRQRGRGRKRDDRGASSRYRGVHFDTRMNKWRARITLCGKRVHLGNFTCEEDAARAYDDNLELATGARINGTI